MPKGFDMLLSSFFCSKIPIQIHHPFPSLKDPYLAPPYRLLFPQRTEFRSSNFSLTYVSAINPENIPHSTLTCSLE